MRLERVGKKRTANNKAESKGLEFLTVQCPSSSVEGKCQKYSISTHEPKQSCGNKRKKSSQTIPDACIHAVTFNVKACKGNYF